MPARRPVPIMLALAASLHFAVSATPANGGLVEYDAPTQEPASKPAVSAAPKVGEIRKFEGHADGVSVVAFSPNGLSALSGSGDGTVRQWEVATGRAIAKLQEPVGNIVGLAFSPDGQRAVAGCYDRTVRLWGLKDQKELKKLEGHGDVPNRVAFAPDGRHAASASWDRTVRLWDLQTGAEVRRFEGHTGVVFGLAFSPDGRRLLSGGWDHTGRIWDVATGRQMARLDGHSAEVGDVAFSADGRIALTGSNDATLRLWEVEGGREVARLENGSNTAWAVALSPDGHRILTSHDNAVALWDIPTRQLVQLFEGHADQVTGVAFAPDGRTALSSGRDRMVRLWGLPGAPAVDRSPGALLARAAEARKRVDFNADGERQQELHLEFAAALREASSALEPVAVGTNSRPSRFAKVMLNGRRLGFDAIRFKSPANGPRLDMKWEFVMPGVGNDRGRAMEAWYILPLKGEMRGFSRYDRGAGGDVEGVDLPDKYHIVQGLEGSEIRPGGEYLIWFTFEEGAGEVPTYVKIDLVPPSPEVQARINATEKALIRTFDFPNAVSGLGVGPDGRRVLAAAGTSIYAGDVEANRVDRLWDEPTGVIRAAAFSPDGKLAAVGYDDGRISLVDVGAGKVLRRCEGHSAAIRCLAFLPDGKKLASGSEDRTARLWDVATGAAVHKLEGHDDQVLCLAPSPDGRRLATGPSVADKVARVWDVSSGKLLSRLEGNAEAVYAIAFSPDGKSIVTGGEDTTLRRYGTDGRPIRRFKPDLGVKLRAVAILPDGRVVVGSDGDVVSFWSGMSGDQLDGYESPLGGTQFIRLARGGRFVTAHGDRTVRVWASPRPR